MTSMIVTDDDMANYICGKNENDEVIDYISSDVVDYVINTDIKEPSLEPEPELEKEEIEPKDPRKTLSYYQVKTIEEGIEWYRQLDPRIPEELLPLFARFNFGDLSTLTKKQLRNENKKKKKKNIDTSIKINNSKNKPYVVTF